MPLRPLPKWLCQWLRVRVRGRIVLVLITGAGLGWIVQAARIQRETVAAIRRDGGLVLYDGHDWQGQGEPGAPKWLVDRLGLDYFGHVPSIAMGQPGWASALRDIGQLSCFERLSLYGPFVTDAGLAHLKELPNLTYLGIRDRHVDCRGTIVLRGQVCVTDAGTPYLKGLAKLAYLDLNGTQVTDAGLAHLAGMTRLRSLRLSNTRVS